LEAIDASRPTPPSVAMRFVPSWPSRCKSNLLREAGAAPGWKELLPDLDGLQSVRLEHRGADWLGARMQPPRARKLRRRLTS